MVKILGIRRAAQLVELGGMESVTLVEPDLHQVTCVQQVQQGLLDLTRGQVAIKEVHQEAVVLYHLATNLPISEIILLVEHKVRTESLQAKDQELLKGHLQIQDFTDKEIGFHQIAQVEEFLMLMEEYV